MAAPSSACLSTKAIWASLNLNLFMVSLRFLGQNLNWEIPARRGPENGQQVQRVARFALLSDRQLGSGSEIIGSRLFPTPELV